MDDAEKKTHSLYRKLNRDYLVLSLVPLIAFFICTITGAFLAQNQIARLIEGSIRELAAEIETQTLQDGQKLIRSRAHEVAEQLNLLVNAHPQITIEELRQRRELQRIAVQQVGLTGYTCLWEAGTGLMRIHPNPELVDRNLSFLSEKLPSFWSIFESSLSGEKASGFYDWIEIDGRQTHKYMVIEPVAAPIEGRSLMVAATTYVDEFLAPVIFTRERGASITGQYKQYVLNQILTIAIVMASVLAGTLLVVSWLSRRAARRFVLPIQQLAEAAAGFGQEMEASEKPVPQAERSDEIGELAQSLAWMRSQISEQFKRIKRSYEKLSKTQEALAKSEAHYRSLFENIPIGVYRTEPGGRILDVNPALVKMFRYPDRESLLSHPIMDLYLNPQDREVFKRRVDECFDGSPCEFQARCHDGTIIWVENQGVAVRDSEGHILYYEGTFNDISRRKLAEEALRESEENFRLLVEHAPVAIFCLNGGRFQYVNPAAVKLFGADTADQIIGRSYYDHIHPDYHEASLVRRRIMTEEKRPVPERELLFFKMDGTSIASEAMGVPFLYRGEQAVLALARDITERKTAQEALRQSEERFRTAFENASVGMSLVTLEGQFIEVNSALASMIGYLPTDLVGQPVAEFTHPDDLDRRLQFADDLAAGRIANGQQERRFVHRDGSVVWTLIWVSLQKDRDGHPLHFISLVQDITERKKTEENLRLAQFCIENAAMGIFRVADDARILEVNAHVCSTLGYSREELLGMTIFDINPDLTPEKWTAHRRRLAEERVRVVQTQHRRKDGTLLPIEIRDNYFEKDGRSFSYSFVSEISERLEREKLETQLRQAQKMEAIGTLAGGIAHDFNNILSVIIGNANILELSEQMVPADMPYLQQILTASDRAKELVQQILTFSRRGEQQRLLVNLTSVIKETFTFLRATLPSSIDVRQSIHKDAGPILADPTQMQQVLMNLCTNAAHAMEGMEAGMLEIGLGRALLTEEDTWLEPDVDPGEYVELTVADTGAGIDPFVRQRMFEPYYTTKEQGKGTGLGLSVVHGIVKSHGGFIKVYSEPGKGTSFHVFFPVASEGKTADAGVADKRLPTGSETLLVVDDEKYLTDMTQQMLERLGYRVETRTSPLEAIEAFGTNPGRYAAVITDMTMPQMNGVSLAKKLLEIRSDLPILLCTGFSDQANEQKARAAGIREFAFKPLALSSLANALRKMLDEAKAATSATAAPPHSKQRNP